MKTGPRGWDGGNNQALKCEKPLPCQESIDCGFVWVYFFKLEKQIG